MAKKTSQSNPTAPQTTTPTPAFLHRVTLLLRRLRAGLEKDLGHPLTYDDLSELVGEPRSTLGNWFNGDGLPSTETILRVLELLPTSEKHQILESLPFCRAFPTLDHPHLAHDPAAVSHLQTLLARSNCTTLVHGTQDQAVTFVIAALGHSFRNLRQGRSFLRGLDRHRPDWFVPVSGVTYLDNLPRKEQLAAEAEKLLRKTAPTSGSLILVNGVWSQLPAMHEAFATLSRTNHVVLGELTRSATSTSPAMVPSPAYVVTVRQNGTNGQRIYLEVQAM